MKKSPPVYVTPVWPGPGAMEGSLSPRFPEIRVKTSSSFAHDYGDMTTIEKVSIVDTPCEIGHVVAAVVAYRGGWSGSGGSSNDEVLATLQAFVEDWGAITDGERVADVEEPADLSEARPDNLPYHAPRYAMHELKGERVVVASYFERGHVGREGRHWSYVVRAYRVKDGAVVDPRGTALPQPRSFTNR